MAENDYRQIDDRSLVELLLRDDDKAWEHVLLSVAMRITQQRKFSEMLKRTSHEPYEAISQLCVELKGNDFARLRSFVGNGSFDGWLYWEVKRAVEIVIYGTRRKPDRIDVADPQDPAAPIERAESRGLSPATYALVADKRAARAKLWQEDPESAYALLMADECGWNYNCIGTFLKRPPNTVAQKISRARKRLRELEQE